MLCGRSRLALFASLQQETIMGTRTVSLLLAICAAGVWAPAHAQNADTSVVKLPQDIVYKGLSGAPQHATLFGDSSQPGLYVDRIKFMPGMKVMPHWHPDSVRTVLVMSGTFYFAVGEQWDGASSRLILRGRYIPNPRDRRIMRGRRTCPWRIRNYAEARLFNRAVIPPLFASIMRPAAQKRIGMLMERGFHLCIPRTPSL